MLFLSRSVVAELFTFADYIVAVEGGFRAFAEGRALRPGLLHVYAIKGEFHVKAGGLSLDDRTCFALKVNGGFFDNPATGLPAIRGIVYLADATDGAPLAVLDSVHLTIQRTGAATALAARHLARPDATVAAICGAGRQGRIQLAALAAVRPVTRAFVWDRSPGAATAYANEMSATLGIPIEPADSVHEAARGSDMVVTCTSSRAPLLKLESLAPGTFVAAVGADSPDKQELEAEILAHATVVTDVTAQCAEVGELHHAIAAGLMTTSDVHAELGDILAGRKPGRRTPEEITVYDATGTAFQDAACAAAIFMKALILDRGVWLSMS